MEKSHNTLEGLPAEWRKRAEYLRAYGDSTAAKLWALAADELEQSIAAHGLETLSLAQASELSGYTPDHLGQWCHWPCQVECLSSSRLWISRELDVKPDQSLRAGANA